MARRDILKKKKRKIKIRPVFRSPMGKKIKGVRVSVKF